MNNVPDSETVQERRSWWQIPETLHCPVIGTCLTMAEQRSILKKAHISTGGLGDHEIHGLLVQSGHAESQVARRVQRTLERKYRSEIQAWGSYDEHEILSLWEAQLRSGQIGAVLWVAATHPCLSEQAIVKIFGDVHMLMHHQGEVVRQELQQAQRLRAQKQQMSDKLGRAWARCRELERALHALQMEHARLERAMRDQEQPEQQEDVTLLRAQLEKAERQNEAQSVVIERCQAENKRLICELASVNALNRLMRAELQDVLKEMLDKERDCQDCAAYDLCGKRVLLVGGLNRLRAVYGLLVADVGGDFRYHDGVKSGRNSALEGMIRWADIVLCPVDINSHGACLSVKNLCKKMDKPYHMMPSSGASTVARVLAEYGEPLEGETCAPA
jgi:hypothetical protein